MDNFGEKFGLEWEGTLIAAALLAPERKTESMQRMDSKHCKHGHQRRKILGGPPNGAEAGVAGVEQVAERAKDERWLNLAWERPWQP